MVPWPTYHLRPKPTVRQQLAAISILLTFAALIVVGSWYLLMSTVESLDGESLRIHRLRTISEVEAAERVVAQRDQWMEHHQVLYVVINVAIAAALVAAAIWFLARVFNVFGDGLDSIGHWDRKIAKRPARKPHASSFRKHAH